MKSRVQDKQKAIELRKQGYSYTEIMNQVSVGKGTLSSWQRLLDLSDEQLLDLERRSKDKRDKGRSKAVLVNRAKRFSRVELAEKEALQEFESYKDDSRFIVGLSLYWAEGTKRDGSVSFINSDPDMVVFMIEWVEKFLKIDRNSLKFRLFIHLPYKNENLESFWSEKIGIEKRYFQNTIYKPTMHNVKKRPNYKGCFRFYYSKIHDLRKIIMWQKLLVNYLKV